MTAPLRRRFLTFGLGRRRPPVRPPWALPEERFLTRCLRCDACREACPEDIIVRGRGGYPEIDFRLGECTFCGDCARACEAGAFGSLDALPWTITAQVTDACLEAGGVVCRACADACQARAIGFAGGTRAGRPAIDAERCRGCGACASLCPVDAIEVC